MLARMADDFRFSFYGGVGEVTGSRHLLEAGGQKILLDCGLFQGHRQESVQRNRTFPFDVKMLDAMLLSHAHIDHSGTVPLLVKNGFRKPIHSTRPTVELSQLMLMDSAHLQQEDAEFFNRLHSKDRQRIEPLYTEEDVAQCASLYAAHEYDETFTLGGKVNAKFLNAGHVLGSGMPLLEIDAPKGKRRLLFTGDLGRFKTILMSPPQTPPNVDYLIIESTYGDRLHDPIDGVEGQMIEVIQRAVKERGKVLIPSFALERTQEIVFILEKLQRQGKIPLIPLYIDSPMSISITKIFEKNLDGFYFDPQFKDYVAKEGNPFEFKTVHYVRTAEESKKLNDVAGPIIILSASGMCEGGRILHHLRNNLNKATTTVLLVGYQAEGTLGSRLQQGARKVRIYGQDEDVAARVHTIHALSSHADKNDLIAFIQGLQPRPKKIFLVHGDPEQRTALAGHLKVLGIQGVETPEFGQAFDLA